MCYIPVNGKEAGVMSNGNDKPRDVRKYLPPVLLNPSLKRYLRESAERQKLNLEPEVLADEKEFCEDIREALEVLKCQE